MRASDVVGDCLDRLSAETGFDLSLVDGACGMLLDDGLEVVIEAADEPGLVHLHAALVTLPAERRGAVIEEALALNLFGTAPDGATLALDRKTDGLVLCLQQPADTIDAEGLAGLLKTFVEVAGELRGRLLEGTVEQHQAQSTPNDFGMGVIRG